MAPARHGRQRHKGKRNYSALRVASEHCATSCATLACAKIQTTNSRARGNPFVCMLHVVCDVFNMYAACCMLCVVCCYVVVCHVRCVCAGERLVCAWVSGWVCRGDGVYVMCAWAGRVRYVARALGTRVVHVVCALSRVSCMSIAVFFKMWRKNTQMTHSKNENISQHTGNKTQNIPFQYRFRNEQNVPQQNQNIPPTHNRPKTQHTQNTSTYQSSTTQNRKVPLPWQFHTTNIPQKQENIPLHTTKVI